MTDQSAFEKSVLIPPKVESPSQPGGAESVEGAHWPGVEAHKVSFDGYMLEYPGGGMNLEMIRALLRAQGLHVVGEEERELLDAWHALPGGDDDEDFSEEAINVAAARWDKAIDAVKVARRAAKKETT